MVGAIIGAGLGAISSLWGAGQSAREMRKARQAYNDYLMKSENDNQDWYNRRYNEDATQRADAQRLLNYTAEQMRRRNKQMEGTQAVMGGTTEGVAAAKEQNAKAVADVASNIAANAAARKDAVENQYLARKQQLGDARATGDLQAGMQRAQNIGQAASAVGGALSTMGGAIDDYVEDTKKKKEEA